MAMLGWLQQVIVHQSRWNRNHSYPSDSLAEIVSIYFIKPK